jgi:bifunctional DNA-binding transcriptional regulator/antitoxin component of YhaV-PrlF toxin-antitoxin module
MIITKIGTTIIPPIRRKSQIGVDDSLILIITYQIITKKQNNFNKTEFCTDSSKKNEKQKMKKLFY